LGQVSNSLAHRSGKGIFRFLQNAGIALLIPRMSANAFAVNNKSIHSIQNMTLSLIYKAASFNE